MGCCSGGNHRKRSESSLCRIVASTIISVYSHVLLVNKRTNDRKYTSVYSILQQTDHSCRTQSADETEADVLLKGKPNVGRMGKAYIGAMLSVSLPAIKGDCRETLCGIRSLVTPGTSSRAFRGDKVARVQYRCLGTDLNTQA